ncbi:MAG: nucleoside deaminase [Solirubrobacterales bacterium]
MQAAVGVDFEFAVQHYFTLLRDRALAAGAQGNYAISAALVIRERGIEVVTVGANTVFGSRDPSGHAEMNTIRLAREVGAAEPGSAALSECIREGSVIVRKAPHSERESILYTTLEPCPMCTVCIITAGIKRVVVAAEDPPSGSLVAERLRSLPPLWPELANSLGLEVRLCQSSDASDPATYLAPELHRELIDIFLASREPLDLVLGRDGALDIRSIHAHATASPQDQHTS